MPSITIGLALTLTSVLGVSTSTAASMSSVIQPSLQAQTVQERVEEYFADEPIMIAVSRCESHFRQYEKDGSVYRGKQNNQDVGIMQINEKYHLETSQKLDLDIYSLDGNLAYAQYLYDKQGTAPWSSSSACWSKSKAAKDLALAK